MGVRPTAGTEQLRQAERLLRRVRARARLVLVARAVAVLLAWGAAWFLASGLLDFLARLPGVPRLALLLIGIGLLGAWTVRVLRPAVRFRPSLSRIALRAERVAAEARGGRSEGLLAAGLEFARDAGGDDEIERDLRGSVTEASFKRLASTLKSAKLVRLGAVLSSLGAAALSVGVLGALVAADRQSASIAFERLVLPFGERRWPSRTDVEPLMFAGVHPSDTALPLRAVLVEPDDPATRVTAVYRVRDEGGSFGPERRVVLSAQRERAQSSTGYMGLVYERLLEPAAFGETGASAREIDIRFESIDDETGASRLRVVDPPRLVAASATIEPPAYADGLTEATGLRAGADLDLGDGEDERAIVGPVLAGSRVRLALRFNKPIDESEEVPAWLAPLVIAGEGVEVARDGSSIVAEAMLPRSVRLPIDGVGADGLELRGEPSFAFDVVEDAEPSVAVTTPPADETVLSTALIEIEGEGRDDLALRELWLDGALAQRDPTSVGAEPEADPLGAERLFEATEPSRRGVVGGRLDLSRFEPAPGDEIWVWAVATDVYEIGGDPRDAVRSVPRRLRVIEESDLIEEVRGRLGAVRRSAMRLDEQQRELRERAGEGEVDGLQREQSTLGERLSAQQRVVEALRERVDRNRLADDALPTLLNEAERVLDRAVEASEAASEALAEAERAPGAEAREAATDAQREVRDELGRLARLLDRGEDGWLARRGVERLLEDQRELAERTEGFGRETVGRELAELTEDQRSELAEIEAAQRELAERARSTIDELTERAQQLSEPGENQDRAQSSAMSRAAQEAASARVPERLDEAASQIGQNQSAQAGEQQEAAIEALERALEELDEAERNRDRQLERAAEELVQAIERLVRLQQEELTRLEALAGVAANAPALAGGMESLHRLTLAASAQAGEAGDEFAVVAELLADAARSQIESVTALRGADPTEAEVAERRSLSLLETALEEAQRIGEEAAGREADRKRRELEGAYRAALEEQLAIRDETEPLANGRLNRRQRADARGLGRREAALRERLEALTAEIEDIAESVVFALAHEQLDERTGAAADRLDGGDEIAVAVTDMEGAIEILRGLLEALDDQSNRDDEFADAASGGGGGGGGGQGGEQPLLPPIAQLKLLRSMQEQAATLTRRANESDDGRVGRFGPAELAELQSTIADTARTMLESMNQQDAPAPRHSPAGPPGGGEGAGGPE